MGGNPEQEVRNGGRAQALHCRTLKRKWSSRFDFQGNLRHKGGDEFIRLQDEVTLLYLGTLEQQVVDTQDGSLVRAGGSASRMKGLEK